MLRIILQGVLIFIVSMTLGGVGVYFYSANKTPEKKLENVFFIKDDLGLVDEVFDDNGILMDQLAYSFDSVEFMKSALSTIIQSGIKAKIYKGRVMVEGGKAGIALDVLSLKGYIPGVENFSFTDVTAEEGSLGYIIQNRLATQNMLSNMIETMADGVQSAEVELKSASIIGDIDSVRVTLQRKDGVKGIKLSDLEDIKSNIIAMTGVRDESIIRIIDSKTGDSY